MAGRPSDIPVDRVRRATEDWFALEWALGLRLVHVHPLTGRPGRVLVTERNLAVGGRTHHADQLAGARRHPLPAGDAVGFDVPRSFRPADGRTSEDLPHGCVSTARPAGRFVTAVIESDDLDRAFTAWADAVRWAVFVGIALTALVCAGAILDWRSLTQASQAADGGRGTHRLSVDRRLVLLVEPTSGWTAWPVFTAVTYASPTLPRLLASPFDFVATALCATGSVLALVHWSETIGQRRARRRGARPRSWLTLIPCVPPPLAWPWPPAWSCTSRSWKTPWRTRRSISCTSR
jgi:hypothetical protein